MSKKKRPLFDIEDQIERLPEVIFWSAVAVIIGGLLCLLN